MPSASLHVSLCGFASHSFRRITSETSLSVHIHTQAFLCVHCPFQQHQSCKSKQRPCSEKCGLWVRHKKVLVVLSVFFNGFFRHHCWRHCERAIGDIALAAESARATAWAVVRRCCMMKRSAKHCRCPLSTPPRTRSCCDASHPQYGHPTTHPPSSDTTTDHFYLPPIVTVLKKTLLLEQRPDWKLKQKPSAALSPLRKSQFHGHHLHREVPRTSNRFCPWALAVCFLVFLWRQQSARTAGHPASANARFVPLPPPGAPLIILGDRDLADFRSSATCRSNLSIVFLSPSEPLLLAVNRSCTQCFIRCSRLRFAVQRAPWIEKLCP